MKWALLWTGLALEILGLLISGVGLARTWREHAEDARFWPSMKAEFTALLRGRPETAPERRRVTGSRDVLWGSASGVPEFAPDMSADAKFDLLLTELDRVASRAEHAQVTADQAFKRIGQLRTEFDGRVEELRVEVDSSLVKQKLDGLPLTVLGLIIVGIGTTLQALSSLWS